METAIHKPLNNTQIHFLQTLQFVKTDKMMRELQQIVSEFYLKKINEDLNKTLTPEMRAKTAIFHLRGGIDSPNLSVPHKIMLKMVHAILAKKKESELTDPDKDILAVYGKTIDFSDKKMLEPMIHLISYG